MAAGEGRRLRPLTECWPKPILPVDGRAVIATLVRQLWEEGFTPVTVVTGHLGEQVERLLDSEDVTFVRQPQALGSADAVRTALAVDPALPALVTVADTLFRSGDLRGFREGFESSGAAGALAFVRRRTAARIVVKAALVRTVVDARPGELAPGPLWALTERIDLDELPGPPYELATAFQRAIDAGNPVAAIEIAPTRQLTEPADLVRENFPYIG